MLYCCCCFSIHLHIQFPANNSQCSSVSPSFRRFRARNNLLLYTFFFDNTHLYFWLRKSVQIQVRMNRIQGQLSRPLCTKAPKQNEKYRKVHGPCATRTLQRTSPTAGLPAIAADESCKTSDHHEHLLRTKALTRATDDEAAEDPSAWDAPRAALTLDRASTSADDGR